MTTWADKMIRQNQQLQAEVNQLKKELAEARGGRLPNTSLACDSKHGTNSSFVPCMRQANHDGDHWSTSGCAGGQFAWSGDAGEPYFHDGNPDDAEVRL